MHVNYISINLEKYSSCPCLSWQVLPPSLPTTRGEIRVIFIMFTKSIHGKTLILESLLLLPLFVLWWQYRAVCITHILNCHIVFSNPEADGISLSRVQRGNWGPERCSGCPRPHSWSTVELIVSIPSVLATIHQIASTTQVLNKCRLKNTGRCNYAVNF